MHATSDHVGFEQRAVIGLQTLTRTRRATGPRYTGPPFSSVCLPHDRSRSSFVHSSLSLSIVLSSFFIESSQSRTRLLISSCFVKSDATTTVNGHGQSDLQSFSQSNKVESTLSDCLCCQILLGCVWLFFTQIRDVKHVLGEHECLKMQAT